MKRIPIITGCIGGAIKELKESIRQIFVYFHNDKGLESISRQMKKTVLRESKALIRKMLSGLLGRGALI